MTTHMTVGLQIAGAVFESQEFLDSLRNTIANRKKRRLG